MSETDRIATDAPEAQPKSNGKRRSGRPMPTGAGRGGGAGALRRLELSKTFNNAAAEVSKRVGTMHACMRDDRWRNHKYDMTRHLGDLQRAADRLQSVIDELTRLAQEQEMASNEGSTKDGS